MQLSLNKQRKMKGEKSVRFPKDKVLNKCVDVYSLFYNKTIVDYDWIEEKQFLDEKIVMVFDKDDDDIVGNREQRVFIAFHEPIRLQEGLNELEKKLNKSYFSFQCQKQANINVKLILNELKRLDDKNEDHDINYDIILCGHSLGGSIAAVTFLQLKTLKCRKLSNSENRHSESLMNLHGNNANRMKETFEYLDNELETYHLYADHEYSCVTHGALLFGNKINKEYCEKRSFTKCLYNYVHEHDPVPKLFHSKCITNFQQIKATAIGNFRILPIHKEIEIEQFLRDSPISLEEDMVYHKFNTYKTPVHADDTELDIVTRTNKDLITLKKPYSVDKIIGEGSYGVVLKGTTKTIIADSDVAIKKIHIEFNSNLIEENIEIKNLKRLNNKHVVKLFDSFVFENVKIYLVFEYCDFGSLQDHVKDKYKETELHDLSVQLLDGLEALHRLKIIHRDIKPGNTLVTHSRKPEVEFCYKLADLGSSGNCKDNDQLLTAIGTELYMSPEIYKAFKKDHKAKINLKTDVFSMASVFLFCLLGGKHPWTVEEFSKCCSDGFHKMISDMIYISNDLKDMLMNMMKINMMDRYSASDLKNHRFIKNETNIKQSTCGMTRMISIQKENIITTMLSRLQVWCQDSWNNISPILDEVDGDIEEPTHKIEERLRSLKELLKLCEINDNEYTIKEQVGYVRADMAICYHHLGDFQNAIIENKKALEMFQQLNGRLNILSAFRVSDNIGNCFYELGNIPKAIFHHKNSLKMKLICYELELTKNDALWESENKLNKPYINNEAIELNYEKVFGLNESSEKESYNIAESLSYLSQCYKGESKHTKAIQNAQEIFNVLSKHDQSKDPITHLYMQKLKKCII